MSKTCDCQHDCNCHDTPPATVPQPVVSPAGKNVLSCRVGMHGTFFEALKQRLTSSDYPALAALRSRQTSDPSIALLDAWAVAADVLTFYNERYINEGYLRTATERRSLVELARLIGYRPGPGVSASVYLAFTLEKDAKQSTEETLIPKGTAVKSVPGDGEQSQTFETADDLSARPEWNAIKPRLSVPQKVTRTTLQDRDYLYLKGLQAKIKLQDRLLIYRRERQRPDEITVTRVDLDPVTNRTRLSLRESPFSRAALFRETKLAGDALLATVPTPTPPPIDNFAKVAKSLIEGDAATGIAPLSVVTALAEADRRIAAVYREALPLKANETLQELNSPTPPPASYLSLPTEIRRVFERDVPVWLQALEDRFAALQRFQNLADRLLQVADTLGTATPFTAGAIAAAKVASPKLTELPPAGVFPLHDQNLSTWIDLIAALDDDDINTQTAYTAALPDLRRWWEGTNGQPTQRAAIASLKAAQATLFATINSPQSWNFPYAGLIAAVLTTFSGAVDAALGTIGAGTQVYQRLNEVKTVFVGSIALAAPITDLEALRTGVVIPAAPVTIIVDHVVSTLRTLLTSWGLPADDLGKHEAAATVATAFQNTLLTYRRFAAAIKDSVLETSGKTSGSLGDAIQRRRTAVLDAHQQIDVAFADLKSNTAANAQLASTELQTLTSGIAGLPKSLDLPLLRPLALLLLDDSGPNPTGAVPDLKEIQEPASTPLGERIGALVDQLESLWRVIAEAGDASIPNVTGGPFQAGGISAVASGKGTASEPRTTTIRLADDVLTIPDDAASDIVPQLVAAMNVRAGDEVRAAWKRLQIPFTLPRVALVGGAISLFGHNAPRSQIDDKLKLITAPDPAKSEEWQLAAKAVDCVGHAFLSQEVNSLPSWGAIYIQRENEDPELFEYDKQHTVTRSDYGLTAKCTDLQLTSGADWRKTDEDTAFRQIRTTTVLYETDVFEIATLPITQSIGGSGPDAVADPVDFEAETRNQIELDNLYLGIKTGMRIAIVGELADSPGVIRAEHATVSYVRHILRELPGDTVHTRLFLETELANRYKRDTVTIHANVVRATHGETTRQVLGSGDAAKAFQKLALAKGPLTHLAAPTPSGTQSTLFVRVNNLLWYEQESLLESQPDSRHYLVHADPAGGSLVQFGDGRTGARLPTGQENLRADYRAGLGTAGNVKARSITQLANSPLGVKEVTNPLPATGGSDPEGVAQLRANAPLAVMALDRLVSVRDYADFARNYAGIDKAAARRLLVAGQPTVHVTIAGVDDLPIAGDSDLMANLQNAFQQLGDPGLVVDIGLRKLLLLFLSAKVRLKPDSEWSSVEPEIRKALYTSFGFSRRELAQDVYLSEVYSAFHAVDGVAYVDVDIFSALAQSDFEDALAEAARPGGAENPLSGVFRKLKTVTRLPDRKITVADIRVGAGRRILPAEIACLSRDVPDSLFLTEIPR